MIDWTEKRESPRIDLFAQVQITREDGCHVMEMINISRGGLFVRGDPAKHPDLSMGRVVDLSIFDPDGTGGQVDLQAVVVRLENGARKGFGMMFVDMDLERMQTLDRFLSKNGYPAQDERRAHPRFDLLAQVQVTRESECYIMATRNVSKGGLFLQGDPVQHRDLMVGTEVELLISDADDPEGEVVELDALIVRIEKADDIGRSAPARGGASPRGKPPTLPNGKNGSNEPKQGFGVKFINVDVEAAQGLERFLASKGIHVG
jgi:hypothetical protein